MSHEIPMGKDEEFQAWMEDWQGGEEADDRPLLSVEERRSLRRRAERFGLGLVLLSVLEIVMSVGLVAWVAKRAMENPSPAGHGLLALTVVLVLVAEGATLWNRRGTWRPHDQSVRAFADLELLRARRQLLSATRIVPLFLLFELVLMIPWIWWRLETHPIKADFAREYFHLGLAWAGVLSALVLAKCVWWASRVRRRLPELQEFVDGLADEEAADELEVAGGER